MLRIFLVERLHHPTQAGQYLEMVTKVCCENYVTDVLENFRVLLTLEIFENVASFGV